MSLRWKTCWFPAFWISKGLLIITVHKFQLQLHEFILILIKEYNIYVHPLFCNAFGFNCFDSQFQCILYLIDSNEVNK